MRYLKNENFNHNRRQTSIGLTPKRTLRADKNMERESWRNEKIEGGLRTRGAVHKKSEPGKPLISIITVVRNGEKYLDQTIQSVLNQTYENIEHIIIDGASTDGTLDIIRKHENQIAYWISEPDRGMYDAINKGIHISLGGIIATLNSDDMYLDKNVIAAVVEYCTRFPDTNGVYGDMIRLYPDGKVRYKKLFQVNYKQLLISQRCTFVPHPTLFLKRKCFDEIGVYNSSYRYASDYDFILRCLKNFKLTYIDIPITYFRIHDGSITSSGKIKPEKYNILRDHNIDSISRPLFRKSIFVYLWIKYKIIGWLHWKDQMFYSKIFKDFKGTCRK